MTHTSAGTRTEPSGTYLKGTAMARVEINAGGRSVAIDSPTDMHEITERALDMWRQVDSPVKASTATGFVSSVAHQGKGVRA